LTKIPSYYWDACIFIAYFNDERDPHKHLIDHIKQFLDEAQSGKCQLITSSITIAEVTAETLKNASVGTFPDFLRDFQSSIMLVSPDPNTMALASHLRSQNYSQPGSNRRALNTPDAIHLATAINLNEIYGTEVEGFHTFDAGKTRGLDGGKGMPLLGFEAWTGNCQADPWVKKVNALKRSVPEHPSPTFNL
jgi:predicted nucleic acid-binding protein